MKITVLTTNTIHHKYFIQEIAKHATSVSVVFENNLIKPNFKTNIKFERLRDNYENKKWFKNKNVNFSKLTNINITEIKNVESKKTIKLINKHKSDFIILFGVKKLSADFISKFKKRIFNLHGGDLNNYRGLDSHYWSIYHNDYNGLVTTLHIASEKLDTGNIVFNKKIKLMKNDKIQYLRKKNTEICVLLTVKLIRCFKKKIKIISKKTKKSVKYYSFMPTNIKKIVEKKFNLHCKNIHEKI